ncbi:MAG: F0F1 ATP synthase subunit gamma [Anaerolineales bacterium]|nr:F0F1 ATP synthase subunit gamma [Anaerolineales bacterium]
MEDILLAESRLENINAVEPILSALRTVSHGTWQKARVKRAAVQDYRRRIQWMTTTLLSSWPDGRRFQAKKQVSGGPNVLILALGSERGLCGQFNPAAIGMLQKVSADLPLKKKNARIWAVGSRFIRLVSRDGFKPEWSTSFPGGALPPFSMALDLTNRILDAYEKGAVDEVIVVYNQGSRTGRLAARSVRLIPPDPAGVFQADEQAVHQSTRGGYQSAEKVSSSSQSWPPPIIETDPVQLLGRLVEHTLTIQMYEFLLASVAAENATRFFLMEEATQNVDRLIDELEVMVQLDRQQKITQEMGELAAGSGLIKVD